MNVYGCDDACSDIHGEEFPKQSEFHEYIRSHIEENVRHISKIGKRRRRDLPSGHDSLGKHSWKYLSLIGDETTINLFNVRKSSSCQILCCVLEGSINIRSPTKLGETGWDGSQLIKSYRDYDVINGESTEFEWNIIPGFTTLQLCDKINDLLSDLGQTPETFTGRILFMSMFNDISCDRKGNKEECLANAGVVKVLARKFGVGQCGHLLDQVLKRSGNLWKRIHHKEFGIISRRRCCWNSPKADVRFSVLRLHCPEVNSKAKDTDNCRFTLQPSRKRFRLLFA